MCLCDENYKDKKINLRKSDYGRINSVTGVN